MGVAELFLTCALTLPGVHFTKPPLVSWQAVKSEEDRLRDWIHKNNPDADIFINERPQAEKLKRNGWERVPFRWRGNEIWIQRKPKSDAPQRKAIEASA